MAWRQSTDDVLGLACGKGNRGCAKVRCTSSSWKKFLLAKGQGSSLRRPSYYTKYSMQDARLGLQLSTVAAGLVDQASESGGVSMTDEL